MTMTYKELAEMILSLPQTQQNQNITIFVPGVDEYYPAVAKVSDSSCDVLDPNHLFLTLAAE